jgi:hypothetical protein
MESDIRPTKESSKRKAKVLESPRGRVSQIRNHRDLRINPCSKKTGDGSENSPAYVSAIAEAVADARRSEVLKAERTPKSSGSGSSRQTSEASQPTSQAFE